VNIGSSALFWQLLQRELKERYVGTALGITWLIIPPLAMLLVYSLVFGEVLQLRLHTETNSTQFALALLTGLAAFNALAEVLTRAPNLLIERRDLLLNSALPAALLPLIPVGVSLVLESIAISLVLLVCIITEPFHWQALAYYMPFLILRLALTTALAYLLAAFGVFLRDLRQLMPALLNVLLLTAPVVYPLSAVPESWQVWYQWHPLTALVEGYRSALLQAEFRSDYFLGLGLLILLVLPLSLYSFNSLLPRARYVL